NACFNLIFRQLRPCPEPLFLDFRTAHYNDDLVVIPVCSGLDHQRRVDDRDAMRIFGFHLFEPLLLMPDDGRMYKAVELGSRLRVLSKDDVAENTAVDRAIRRKYAVPELFDDCRVNGLAWPEHLICDSIRIDQMAAQFDEHRPNSALARGNTAR